MLEENTFLLVTNLAKKVFDKESLFVKKLCFAKKVFFVNFLDLVLSQNFTSSKK